MPSLRLSHVGTRYLSHTRKQGALHSHCQAASGASTPLNPQTGPDRRANLNLGQTTHQLASGATLSRKTLKERGIAQRRLELPRLSDNEDTCRAPD